MKKPTKKLRSLLALGLLAGGICTAQAETRPEVLGGQAPEPAPGTQAPSDPELMASMVNEPALLQSEGVIQGLDFENSMILISGMEFKVSQTVKVQIAGSFGAFGMLQPGMGVRYLVQMAPGGTDTILEIYEKADAVDF